MTIHTGHPFDDGSRDAARQLRARLGGRVTVFTSGSERTRAGWTVSSLSVVAGDPWRVVCFVDPDCDLADRVEQTGTAVCQFLDADDQQRVPLYRQYNPNAAAGSHNYTTSIDEHWQLVGIGWQDEGISWYGL